VCTFAVFINCCLGFRVVNYLVVVGLVLLVFVE